MVEVFIPPALASVIAGAFLGLLAFVLLLNIFSLPANWIIVALVGLWQLLWPDAHLGVLFWIGLLALAVLGEVLETGAQIIKARKYGCSSSGTFAGMIGAIIGAIALAPLFWGLGALLGAIAGGGLGCYLMEILKGRSSRDAFHAAVGTMIGRFLGTSCKIAVGAAMILFTYHHIWPESVQPLSESFLTFQTLAYWFVA